MHSASITHSYKILHKKKLLKMSTQKKINLENFMMVGMLSLVILIVLMAVATSQFDCRYAGLGIMQFGSFYFGSMSLPFLIRRRDLFDMLCGIILMIAVILCFGFGAAVFFHHYGINLFSSGI